MIRVIIYLEQSPLAEPLAKELVRTQLAATASIDKDNNHFTLENEEVVMSTRTVITLHTKALLFAKIVQHTELFLGEQVPICAVPITQADEPFYNTIRNNTIKI